MKLTRKQREQIKLAFHSVKTENQLAELLHLVYKYKFPSKNQNCLVQIQARDLTYQAFVNKNRYSSFGLAKRSGGIRPITAPNYKLKTIQKCLNEVLLALLTPHVSTYGFVLGKSVVDNAKNHVSRNFVYNIDLKDFFPSISFRRIKTVLELSPFNLTEDKEPLAFLIANLCCHDGSIPQGAPTSPTLSNIVCQRLDRKLYIFAKKHRAFYSRYVDDITFSARFDVFNDTFKANLEQIIQQEENFELNPSKERKSDWKVRQLVTGVVVNQKLNVPREFIKDIRYWLRTWKRFGYDKTQKDFLYRYQTKKGFQRHISQPPLFHNYLLGKILYLGMIRGKNDNVYNRFRSLYQDASDKHRPEFRKDNDFFGSFYDANLGYVVWNNLQLAERAKFKVTKIV